MRKSFFKNILLAFALVLASASCQAASKDKTKADSCLCKALGDSISHIIQSSRHIRTFICNTDKGKIINTNIKKLSRKQNYLFKFLLSNPQMSKHDEVVFGHFSPCIGFELKKSNKEKVFIYADFGLGKWMICNAQNKQIKRFDIEGYELLRFSTMLYPTDEFMTSIYNNRLSK